MAAQGWGPYGNRSDLDGLREDILILTGRLAHAEIELRAIKTLTAITFLIALIVPMAVYFALV